MTPGKADCTPMVERTLISTAWTAEVAASPNANAAPAAMASALILMIASPCVALMPIALYVRPSARRIFIFQNRGYAGSFEGGGKSGLLHRQTGCAFRAPDKGIPVRRTRALRGARPSPGLRRCAENQRRPCTAARARAASARSPD